jgi:hypothetical protein
LFASTMLILSIFTSMPFTMLKPAKQARHRRYLMRGSSSTTSLVTSQTTLATTLRALLKAPTITPSDSNTRPPIKKKCSSSQKVFKSKYNTEAFSVEEILDACLHCTFMHVHPQLANLYFSCTDGSMDVTLIQSLQASGYCLRRGCHTAL